MKQTLTLLLLSCALALASVLRAELKLPAIIGDHMVLQQKQANPIWGWDTPGTRVTVKFSGQSYTATAGSDGRWTVKLAAAPANATPQILSIAGTTQRDVTDVLIGEVWMCSGQSNMQWSLGQTYTGDIEGAGARRPNLRIVSVPQVGTQEPQDNFNGAWSVCSPESVGNFSAVGYLFGSRIHSALGVPVGLIDNAWGGSAAEAWVPRNALEADGGYAALLNSWDTKVAAYTDEMHAAKVAEYKVWLEAGKPGKAKHSPRDFRAGQHRPAHAPL